MILDVTFQEKEAEMPVGFGEVVGQPWAVLYKQQSLTDAQKAQARENIGVLEAEVSQGRSAKYHFTTAGWKRVLNVIRATSGIVEIGIASGKPHRMVQCLAFDFTGFVKYPEDTSKDTAPIIVKRYENTFGEDDAVSSHPFRITKIRIGYPKDGTEFPETDGVTNYKVNPVNCYLDVYIDFKETDHKYLAFGMNYAGYAESHNCTPITEETDAVDTGIYGEELTYYEVDVDSMPKYINSEMPLPYLSNDIINSAYGVQMNSDGYLAIYPATNSQIDSAASNYRVITPKNVGYAVNKHTKELQTKVSSLEDELFERTGDLQSQIYDIFRILQVE